MIPESVQSLSSQVGLEGTGDSFRTPVLYRFCEIYLPSIIRSITNIHFRGLSNIPRSGAAIFTANHLSNLDPFIKIIAAQRPIHFLAKEGHFQKQPNRFVMINTGQIETFRKTGGKDALARAVDVLQSGGCLGIFPEGTRSRAKKPPYLQRGKTGVARLAARFPEIPIVPITIVGAREFLPPGANFPRIWKRVQVVIDKPITFGAWVLHQDGGALNPNQLDEICSMEEQQMSERMGPIYRKFTDQLIETLRRRGAP